MMQGPLAASANRSSPARPILHQQAMLTQALGIRSRHIDVPTFKILAAIKHGCGHGAGGGDEALDQAGPPAAGLEPAGEGAHVVVHAKSSRDEIEALFAANTAA